MIVKKSLVLFIFFIFITNFHILPVVNAITIEEQAAKSRMEKMMDQEKSKSGKAGKKKKIFQKEIEPRSDLMGRQKKDPRLACLLSLIIPGGGQIYLRKDLKGIGFCLAAGIGYSVTGYYIYYSFVQNPGTDFRTKIIISGLLFFVSVLVHIVGIVEAYSDANEINKENYYGLDETESPYVARLVVE